MQTFTEVMRETTLRDETARLNRQALCDVMRDFSIVISQRDFDTWRPTKRNTGDITGVAYGLQILCTDGVLAHFLKPTGEVLLGHIQCFSGEVAPLYSMPKERVIKEANDAKRRPRKSLLDRALELLQNDARSVVQKNGQDSRCL